MSPDVCLVKLNMEECQILFLFEKDKTMIYNWSMFNFIMYNTPLRILNKARAA